MPITRSSVGGILIDEYAGKGKFQAGGVVIHHPCQVNIYDSKIGRHTRIASFVEIGGSDVGEFCKIEAGVFIPPGTVVEDHVFIGPGVVVCNDKYPDLHQKEWKPMPVTIRSGARIGAGAVILPGVTVGKLSVVGAGSVVTKDVAEATVVYGNPAKSVAAAKTAASHS